MLRISVLNDPRATRLKLEGKLAHEWVCEAEKVWAGLRAMNGKKSVILDLFDVSFVDDSGWQLLSEMHRAGAKLLGSGPLMSALIEEIQQSGTRPAANGSNQDRRQLNHNKAEVEP